MLSFEGDIKGLFREFDREEMEFVFDLWSYEDVREHSADILGRLEEGDMPCDEPWPAERIATFRTWIEEGLNP
jgi:hypothetical protein